MGHKGTERALFEQNLANAKAAAKADKKRELTDEDLLHMLDTFGVEEASAHGTQIIPMSDRQNDLAKPIVHHLRKQGYLIPST